MRTEMGFSASGVSTLSSSRSVHSSVRREGLRALLVVALVAGTAGAMRVVFSPLQELARVDLRLSDFQVSLVQGLAASIPVALLALPIGRLTDRVERVRLLGLMALLWTAGTALTAFSESFSVLFVARMLCGFGVFAGTICASLSADLSTPERRGRALMILSLGLYCGGAAAFALGGWLSGWLASGDFAWLAPDKIQPWRAVHVLFCVAGLALMAPLLWLREPSRKEVGQYTDASIGVALRQLWSRRRFLIPLFVGQITVLMADTAANIWASPVLMRDHGLQPAQFGSWMALAVLLPGIVGSILGGYLADLGQKLNGRGGLLIGAVVSAAVSIPAAFFPVMPTVEGFGWMLGILQLTGVVTGLITTTAIAVAMPNELRGICLSALFVISAVVAFGIAPTLVTVLSDALGGEAHLAEALASSGAAISAVAVVGFILAMKTMPRPSRNPAGAADRSGQSAN